MYSKSSIKRPVLLNNLVHLRTNWSYCFISGLPRPIFGLYQTTSTLFFSDYRSLERPGLIIKSLEFVHKIVKTKIIVPKTSFRLTENFLADAFAFLWSDRHASYVQEHVHHYSATTGHPASLWEMFSFFDWDSQFGHMMTTISSKVIYSKYFRNSNESCTFLLLERFGHRGSLLPIDQSKCLKHKLEH